MDLSQLQFLYKNPLTELISDLNEELKNFVGNRLLEYYSEEFSRNYFSKNFIQRTNPVPLDSFYYPLTLLEKKERKEKYNQIPTESNVNRIPTNSIKSLFKFKSYIFIVGGPGSGKSTLVKDLFVKCLKEKYKIPIKIELRRLNFTNEGLRKYILDLIFQTEKIVTSKDITERALHSGKFVFFLDGYDELRSNIKESVLVEINEFTKKYKNNNFIVTSRPHTSDISPEIYTTLFVAQLRQGDIPKFIYKQLKQNRELAELIIESIEEVRDKEYRSFLVNPLLLSMFILRFENYAETPSAKSLFYYQVFETLFSAHDALSKTAFLREKISGLNKTQIEQVLEILCFLSFFNQYIEIDSRKLNEYLNVIKTKKEKLNFVNDQLIEDLTTSIGILIYEGGFYSFPHRSLQEYFAASHIAKLKKTQTKQIIYRKIADQFGKFGFYMNNLLSLLNEIDDVDYHRYLVFKQIENVKKAIQNNSVQTPDDYSSILSSIFSVNSKDLNQRIQNINRKLTHYADKMQRNKEFFKLNITEFENIITKYYEEKIFEIDNNFLSNEEFTDMI